MKLRISFFVAIFLLAILTGCNDSKITSSDNIKEKAEENTVIEGIATLSVLDVMEQMTSAYPEYNTFVLIDNTVHIMTCDDSTNPSIVELAREISSITNTTYELVAVKTVEDTHKWTHQKIRYDVIDIEDSDGVRNQSTNEIVAFWQQGTERLEEMYGHYEVVVRQSVPGEVDYTRKRAATVTELMGYVEPNALAGFVKLETDDYMQTFFFPDSYFDRKFHEKRLTTHIWDTTTPVEEQEPTSDPAVVVDNFLQEMLYGEGESFYNVFMSYESFYGPQTEEQMRSVLGKYKEQVMETLYVTFAKSFDHTLLETALQSAHAEMDSWLDEYLSKNRG